MEDLTEGQVLEIAAKIFPNLGQDQIMQAFNKMKEQFQLSNYETVLLIQEQLKNDKSVSEGGQFPNLISRIRGRK